MAELGLDADAALLPGGARETVSLPYASLRRRAGHADLLLNVSGMLTDKELLGAAATTNCLTPDNAFNQSWHSNA